MINTNIERPEVFEKLFSKNIVSKLIGFDEWVEKNKQAFEEKYENNNNNRPER